MPELVQNFMSDVAEGPQWVEIWVNVLAGVLMLSIPFSFVRTEARVVLAGFLLGAGAVIVLYSQFGLERILGLGHIVFWTPLLVWLLLRRDKWQVRETLSGKWLVAATAVLAISLAFDYVDVVRWLLGERG